MGVLDDVVLIKQNMLTGEDSAEFSHDGHEYRVEMVHSGWWEGEEEDEASARVFIDGTLVAEYPDEASIYQIGGQIGKSAGEAVGEGIDDESWQYAYALLTFHAVGKVHNIDDEGRPRWKLERTMQFLNDEPTVEFDSEIG